MDREPQETILDAVIDATRDLPAPPAILTQVIELTGNADTPQGKVADVLATDPAVAAEILRHANSAIYARSRSVSSLFDAVTLLGFRTIRSIVVAVSAKGSFASADIPGDVKDGLWEHSLATAVFSRLLATKMRVCHPDDAYTAGLLHDIGKLVLCGKFKNAAREIYRSPENDATQVLESETQILGVSHSLVGAALVDRWLLPEEISAAARLHHEHFAPDSVAGIVALGDIFVSALGYNFRRVSAKELARIEEYNSQEETQHFEDVWEMLQDY